MRVPCRLPLMTAIILSVLSTLVVAQPNTSSYAELVFYNNSGNLTTPVVSVQLKGVVFREDGKYATSVEYTHPYTSSSLTSGTSGEIPRHEYRFWESACPADIECDPDSSLGLIGWGEYEVTITDDINGFNPEVLTFTINTIDGEWCYPVDDDKHVSPTLPPPSASSRLRRYVTQPDTYPQASSTH